jgi:hypothetical protein
MILTKLWKIEDSVFQKLTDLDGSNLYIYIYIQWNLSKLTTDRSWNSGQNKQVVNLDKCVPNNYLLMHKDIAQHINGGSYGQKKNYLFT